ncbi:Putative box C/D snoRNA protein [Tolypocladium paradoxum]|uniref:Box C/D snoRNA protein 1 n=1 Tax=Tolypocladium paradoxum TaxID=94208 RepID=A0A2S4L4R9_9HYPO|nr:Putative box C/D snoRNA protein [Tolypocladium paradoxum]
MADPLLTSLCSICHVSAPKYKCPRCSIQTCSVACIMKHKAWSECSGERDPTTYIPRSQLCTVSGVNHDYNFLHSLGMSVERAERVLVGDKGLVQGDELRPQTVQQVKWTTGRDGRKRKVMVTRVLNKAKGRKFERFLAQRLRQLNVEMVCAPVGMERQKENSTTFNHRSRGINWQVEWLVFNGKSPGSDSNEQTTTRTLSKMLEDVPLHQAYRPIHEEKLRAESGQQKKPQKGGRAAESQRHLDSKWNFSADSTQDPSTGHWISYTGTDVGEGWPGEMDKAQRQEFQFFLGGPPARSDLPTKVTALDSGDCLRDVLANTRVREFPTLYVLRTSEMLPAGFVLAPKETIPPPQGAKRKGGSEAGDKKGRQSAKRRRQDGDGLEEGEVGSDDGEGHGDDVDEDGSKGVVGMEEGEEVAEESWGKEEDDDDDDSTSSSGSDVESD